MTLFDVATPLDLAMQERDAGALFVLNHSGGKDSQAMLIEVLRHVPAAQILVVHATLGESEWPGALEHAQAQAEAAGCAFIVAEAGKTFLGMVERRYQTRPEVPSWPSSSTRQCTSDLKRGPITREVRRYATARGITRIVNCMGMRAQESSARAKKPAWAPHAEHGTAGRSWYDWLPIHDMSTADVLRTVADADQQLHPAYALGNDRLSCVFCLFGSAGDLRNGAQQNPELYARYVEMERRTGYTLHMSRKSLEEITGVPA
ncbi:phosphoadenosine phosphosulfate reductase family protein [Deinococcus sp. A31D244]|uniref:phosphoadenosine phosphosulfate reductase domain-containing protein n=1 Tax=Deinococcus sp. A31D244 TaxID=3397675 RepID=UPI0039E18019